MPREQKQSRYQGLTRKQYKQRKALTCSAPGKTKNALCQATGLEKAMIKYPRSIKTSPELYFGVNLKRDLLAGRTSFFTQNK